MKQIFVIFFICAILITSIPMIFYHYDNDPIIIIQTVPQLEPERITGMSCYTENSNEGLPNLDDSEEKKILELGKNIFFHETSCYKNDGLFLKTRAACAVESAAKMNPNMTIYFLFLSPSKISKSSELLFQQLKSYPNIKMRRIHINDYVKNTPLEGWYSSEILKQSNWPKSHMSDILRYLTLWKYRGIYLDLDIVVLRSLRGLYNFVGVEDKSSLNAAVLGIGTGDLGTKVAEACLEDLKTNFEGHSWANNGPGVITRVMRELCNTEYPYKMITNYCDGFMVHHPSSFFPIHFNEWIRYFNTDKFNETMKLIEQATTIHIWNKLSEKEKIPIDSQTPYALIAKKFCPKVYNNCGKTL